MTSEATPLSGYAVLDHTADVGLAAWGATPADAFVQAGRGMFAVIFGAATPWPSIADSTETREVEVGGPDWSDLLVNWLAELLFLFETERFIAVSMRVEVCKPPVCRAQLSGHRLPEGEVPAGLMIKAVTYHQIQVNLTPLETDLRVILDV